MNGTSNCSRDLKTPDFGADFILSRRILIIFMKKDWIRSGNTQRISLQNGRLLHISPMMGSKHPCADIRYSSHSMQLRPAAGNASANGTRYNPAGS